MLIRFDSDNERGPSPVIWRDLVDWVRGSLAAALGQRDFQDFAPAGTVLVGDAVGLLASTQVSGSAGAAATVETDRFGRILASATAGTNAQVALARQIHFDLQNSPVVCVGANIKSNADANSPQQFVGLTSQAAPDDVFAAGVVNANGDAIGILWNADETFDIVAVDAATKNVLKDDIGVTVDRGLGDCRVELRIEKVTSATYRLTPCINGKVARSGAVNVEATKLPEGAMRPVVAQTVEATTAPSIEVDWLFSADK